jgi:hypothetical protein
MLKYNHVFNTTDTTKPFHIHQIQSDTSYVEVAINDRYIGKFKPNYNASTGIGFTKRVNITDDLIFNLLLSGSLASYDPKTESAIFSDEGIVYINNTDGEFLSRNQETGKYFWSADQRSRFFFNPYYFDSEYLWKLKFGTMPTGVNCSCQWPDLEQSLFLGLTYTTDRTWPGEEVIQPIEPLSIDYYARDEGIFTRYLYLDYILDLPHVLDGDVIKISNGNDLLEVEVKNSGEPLFIYENSTVTDRPMVHVPIRCINPNELVHYTKGLEPATQEVISLTLNNKSIQFKIKRI